MHTRVSEIRLFSCVVILGGDEVFFSEQPPRKVSRLFAVLWGKEMSIPYNAEREMSEFKSCKEKCILPLFSVPWFNLCVKCFLEKCSAWV